MSAIFGYTKTLIPISWKLYSKFFHLLTPMEVDTLLAANESFIYFATHTLTSRIDIDIRIVSIQTRIEIIYSQVSSGRLKKNAWNRFKLQHHWGKYFFLLSVFLVFVCCLPSICEQSRCSTFSCFSLQRGVPKTILVINCYTRMILNHSTDFGEACLTCEGS